MPLTSSFFQLYFKVVEIDPDAEELLALEESKQALLDEEDFLEYKVL